MCCVLMGKGVQGAHSGRVCMGRGRASRATSRFTFWVCEGAESLGGERMTKGFPIGALGSNNKK